jgi:hypothetical protein
LILLTGPAVAAEPVSLATVAVQAVAPVGDGRARVSECSGALIGPDLVLTAGHCLDGIASPAQVAVFSYDGEAPRVPHLAVAAFARHPDHVVGWREAPGDPETRRREIAGDLALLRLAAPAPGRTPAMLGSGTAPAPKAASLASVGREGAGAAARSGRLRTTSLANLRAASGPGPLIAFATAAKIVCGGDSGGAVATTGGAEAGRIWGVVAAVLRSTKGCGARVVIAPVDPASEGFRRMKAALGAR